ncbi:hypothetical protein DAI22_06g245400 [Oryza sativa Japonica Group]|nr:hypothetical protein DAI22_06g245400 [Oryza sativa Japonica Group]
MREERLAKEEDCHSANKAERVLVTLTGQSATLECLDDRRPSCRHHTLTLRHTAPRRIRPRSIGIGIGIGIGGHVKRGPRHRHRRAIELSCEERRGSEAGCHMGGRHAPALPTSPGDSRLVDLVSDCCLLVCAGAGAMDLDDGWMAGVETRFRQ